MIITGLYIIKYKINIIIITNSNVRTQTHWGIDDIKGDGWKTPIWLFIEHFYNDIMEEGGEGY